MAKHPHQCRCPSAGEQKQPHTRSRATAFPPVELPAPSTNRAMMKPIGQSLWLVFIFFSFSFALSPILSFRFCWLLFLYRAALGKAFICLIQLHLFALPSDRDGDGATLGSTKEGATGSRLYPLCLGFCVKATNVSTEAISCLLEPVAGAIFEFVFVLLLA